MVASSQLAPTANLRLPAAVPQVSPLSIDSHTDPTPPLRDASVRGEAPALDIYGNEVNDAVATYKLDATGSLYEEHSPTTEIPRLGVPTT